MRLALSTLVAAAVVITAGCSDSTMSTNPSRSTASSISADKDGSRTKSINLMDECDGASFTANGVACSRNAGVTFDQFFAQLTSLHEVPEWKMAPGTVNLRVGDVLSAMNTGGETHTFTQVKAFGGGIVPALNAGAGLTTVAPECHEAKFLPPGASTSAVASAEGTEMYQCCIHPWMRAIVHVSGN